MASPTDAFPDAQVVVDRARTPLAWLLPLLAILFFCSGVASLIYQLLWLRLLGLVFGVTTYAASTVWASFMAGLAIGSIGAGRLADRVRRPLLWFGAVEILIGATALSTPFVIRVLQQGYVALHPVLPEALLVVTLARFVISFAVLIVPTVLMGATLPLVVKSAVFRTETLGSRIGVLYGTNTAGAIVGALVAGLYLIPELGIQRAFLIGAGLNLAIGVTAFLAGRAPAAMPRAAAPALTVASVPSAVHLPAPPGGPGRRVLTLVLVVFALSGFTTLALEVVWFRVLTLFLRPTVYGFALMLAAVLAGIALGSYLVTPFLERRIRWIGILGGLQVGIALAAARSFNTLADMMPLTTSLRPWLLPLMPEYLIYPLVGSALAIFPTTLLLGIAFPIGLRLWARGGAAEGHVAGRIGVFYGVNVAGSIAGSLLAGFLLLPLLGSRASLVALAAVTLASGLLLIGVSEWRRPLRVAAALIGCVAFVAVVIGAADPFDQFVAQRYPGQHVLWKEEGVDATVVVQERAGGERILTLNGNHQASTGGAMVRTHRIIGHLPMLLHPMPYQALVIGLGGGATAGAVSLHDTAAVDVVELSGAVVRAAAFLSDANSGVLERPNVHIRVDDGRNYMLLTRRSYDVITADVILPIYAGSGNLYSAEYFRLMRRVLKPGGLVLQWVAGTDAEYKAIARTFLSVFPETTVWGDGTLLIGSLEPLRLQRRAFEWKLELRGDALRDAGVTSFDQLTRLYVAGPEELRAFVGPGPILTDDRPLVEFFLSLPRDTPLDLTPLRGDVSRIVEDD